jgi:hypothetical protein
VNRLQKPTYEKLDRVLVSTDWELQYPNVTVHTLTREISDHTPLLVDTRNSPMLNKAKSFKFELSWLLKDGFYEMVAEIWNREEKGITSIDRWQNKISYLRKYLRGWVKHTNGTYKKEKKELTEKIE